MLSFDRNDGADKQLNACRLCGGRLFLNYKYFFDLLDIRWTGSDIFIRGKEKYVIFRFNRL